MSLKLARRQVRDAFLARFAGAVRQRIRSGEVTVRDVADVCGCSVQAVHLWLNERCEPGGYAVTRLCLLFGEPFQREIAGVIELRPRA